MTTDNDSVRADFQKQFPIPESCEWLEIYREYVWDETTTRHPHNDLWESWQASRERYVPRWIPVSERLPVVTLQEGEFYDSVDFLVTDGFVVRVCAFESGATIKPWSQWSECGGIPPSAITHWQPLPTAPNGGNGE